MANDSSASIVSDAAPAAGATVEQATRACSSNHDVRSPALTRSGGNLPEGGRRRSEEDEEGPEPSAAKDDLALGRSLQGSHHLS